MKMSVDRSIRVFLSLLLGAFFAVPTVAGATELSEDDLHVNVEDDPVETASSDGLEVQASLKEEGSAAQQVPQANAVTEDDLSLVLELINPDFYQQATQFSMIEINLKNDSDTDVADGVISLDIPPGFSYEEGLGRWYTDSALTIDAQTGHTGLIYGDIPGASAGGTGFINSIFLVPGADAPIGQTIVQFELESYDGVAASGVTGQGALNVLELGPASIDVQLDTNGEQSDTAPGEKLLEGSSVTSTYAVSTNGPTAFRDVTVTDSTGINIDCGDGTNIIALLLPGVPVNCTASRTASLGQFSSTATVAGLPVIPDFFLCDCDPTDASGSGWPTELIFEAFLGPENIYVDIGAEVISASDASYYFGESSPITADNTPIVDNTSTPTEAPQLALTGAQTNLTMMIGATLLFLGISMLRFRQNRSEATPS